VSEGKDDHQAEEGERRTFVNLVAVVAILLLAIGAFWIIRQLDQTQKMEACLEAHRNDCDKLNQTPGAP